MHPVLGPEAEIQLLRRRLGGDQQRYDGLCLAGDMEILEVEGIAMDLLHGVTGKAALAHLIFENEDQPAGDDDGIGAPTHARNAEFQEDLRLRQGGADPLQMRDGQLPGRLLGRFGVKGQGVHQAPKDRHGVGGGQFGAAGGKIGPLHGRKAASCGGAGQVGGRSATQGARRPIGGC